jgi:hypothetical protein
LEMQSACNQRSSQLACESLSSRCRSNEGGNQEAIKRQ